MNENIDIIINPTEDTSEKCIFCLAEVKKDFRLLGFIYYLGPKPISHEISLSKNDNVIIITAGAMIEWNIDMSVFCEKSAQKINDVLYWLPVKQKEFLYSSSDSSEFTHHIETTTFLDYTNTCREGQVDLPLFQNNVFFSIENTGTSAFTIRDILINDKSWWTIDGILKDIGITPSDDINQETVLKIWDFVRKKVSCGKTYQHLFNDEMSKISIVDFFNYLGSGACGTYSSIFVLMCAAVGIPARRGSLSDGSHVTSQVLLENKDIILDAFYGPDKEGEGVRGSFFVNNDNQLASYNELCHDHYLAYRAGRLNIGELASLFGYHDTFQNNWTDSYTDEKTIDLTLFEDEMIEWYMHPIYSEIDDPFRQRGRLRISNNLASDRFFTENLVTQKNSAISDGLGTLQNRLELPYPINGVNLKASLLKGNIKVEIKTESSRLFKEYSCSADSEPTNISIILDDKSNKALFTDMTFAIDIIIISDDNTSYVLQELFCEFYSYNKSLMNIRNGKNSCRLVFNNDESPKNISVKHGFLEFPETHIPNAPDISIKNNKITLQDTMINKYEYIISEKPACRIPVSPKHQELTDKKEILIESDGILCPGQEYYVRARSISVAGITGPWSNTEKFTFKSLISPIPDHVEYLSDGVEIYWQPVSSGSEKVYYDIYGSCEKGFTPSKTPYNVWIKRIDDPAISSVYPGNYIATTKENSIKIPFFSDGIPFPAHFRIKAHTENLTGPASEMISLTTPYIVKSSIQTIVPVEQPYSCFLKSILSLGSLHFNRLPDNPIYTSFLNREVPVYELEGNPSWLQIRPEDGYLYGTPEKKDRGEYNFNIKCSTHIGESMVMVSVKVI